MNGTKKVFHRPLLDVCAQKCFIPTWALTAHGMVIELLVTNSLADPLLRNLNNALAGDGSQDWSIESVRLHSDIVRINSNMLNSYASHILAGESLTLPMRSYSTVRFTNAAEQTLLQIPRTFSRLNTCVISFFRPDGGPSGSSQTNYLWSPPDTISTTLQCGSYKMPQNRYEGRVEHYYRYLKGLGLIHSAAHSANVSFFEFGQGSFQALFDLKKISQAPHSGLSTHEGVLSIDIRGMGLSPPTLIYVHLFHDLLCEISDGQVFVAI